MDVNSAASIIARMKEDYASVHAPEGASAKDRYYSQANALSAFAEENNGLAFSARELDYGPAVKIPFSNFTLPSPGGGDIPSGKALDAYSEGASIAVKPQYGSLKLLKFGKNLASREMLTNPEQADDGTLAVAADRMARELQKAKDQEAVRADMTAIFRQNGIPETTLYQLDFDQRPDGSISVGNHPLAAQVEALVNSDRGLADMLSFSFGFNSRTSATA